MDELRRQWRLTRIVRRGRDHVIEQEIEINRPAYAAALPISSRKYEIRNRSRWLRERSSRTH